MDQLRQLIAKQAEAMKRFESHSQQFLSQQQEEYAHKQHTQFQQFDGALRDKDEAIQALRQELANNMERHLQELDQALQDAERRAQQASPVFAAASTQAYATPVEKETLNAVAAVAQAPLFRSFIPQDPGLVRRRMRSKGPPSQASTPASSSSRLSLRRIQHTQEKEEMQLLEMVNSDLEIVHYPHQDFLFNKHARRWGRFRRRLRRR